MYHNFKLLKFNIWQKYLQRYHHRVHVCLAVVKATTIQYFAKIFAMLSPLPVCLFSSCQSHISVKIFEAKKICAQVGTFALSKVGRPIKNLWQK